MQQNPIMLGRIIFILFIGMFLLGRLKVDIMSLPIFMGTCGNIVAAIRTKGELPISMVAAALFKKLSENFVLILYQEHITPKNNR